MIHFGYSHMTEAVTESVETAKETAMSELSQPRWAVVSFEKLEASGLPYAEAFNLLETLDQKGVTGLCIVSDEAGKRLH